MELTIVGCSGSVSGPDSAASSYLVQAPYEGRTFSLLLDCGPGAFGALYRHLDPAGIDAVALSHLHPDHCLDLTGFYVAATYSPSAPWQSIPVYAPAGAATRLDRAYDASGTDPVDEVTGPSAHFRFTDWQPEQQIGPFTVQTSRVEHPVPAYAVRLEERTGGRGDDRAPRSLVYSGDTGPCAALVELAREADLLLCEAAFLDGSDHPPGIHLTAGEAVEHAEAAGVGTLVLTHIPPWYDAAAILETARARTAVPVHRAIPGARFPVG